MYYDSYKAIRSIYDNDFEPSRGNPATQRNLLSRLVFAVFLVHPIVIRFYNAQRVTPIHLSFLEVIYTGFGHMGVSAIIGFLFHFLIERPMSSLFFVA